MTKTISKIVLPTAACVLLFTACKNKIEEPQPSEPELITTMRLITQETVSGSMDTFTYRVENGFGSGTQGTVSIDTIVLDADKTYNVNTRVLNEQATPAEDITEEVLDEKENHLFFYTSTPATGAGSITAQNGSADANNQPFNQTINFKAGGKGAGKLVVTLKHKPTNKLAATVDAAGGQTDAEASFPVIIK